MNKKRLAIIGSGDLGHLIAHHAENDANYSVVGFFDDFKKKGTKIKSDKIILGNTKDILGLFERGLYDEIIIGIGYKHMDIREAFFERFEPKIPFATIIHSSAYIDKSSEIGMGVFILPGCTIDANVSIENNVLLNTGVVIAHDTIIQSHTFLGPGVTLAGFVNIGKRCFLGINTTVIDNIKIINDVQTGGGTVVIKDINKTGLYVGVPSCKIN